MYRLFAFFFKTTIYKMKESFTKETKNRKLTPIPENAEELKPFDFSTFKERVEQAENYDLFLNADQRLIREQNLIDASRREIQLRGRAKGTPFKQNSTSRPLKNYRTPGFRGGANFSLLKLAKYFTEIFNKDEFQNIDPDTLNHYKTIARAIQRNSQKNPDSLKYHNLKNVKICREFLDFCFEHKNAFSSPEQHIFINLLERNINSQQSPSSSVPIRGSNLLLLKLTECFSEVSNNNGFENVPPNTLNQYKNIANAIQSNIQNNAELLESTNLKDLQICKDFLNFCFQHKTAFSIPEQRTLIDLLHLKRTKTPSENIARSINKTLRRKRNRGSKL